MLTPTDKEILNSRDLIIAAFKDIRPLLLANYGKLNHTTKSDGTPVTALDIEVESQVKQRLLAKFPFFGFSGEETAHVVGSYDATWYVDPIDSTASFLRGLPFCTNMAGLVIEGEIVASVIYHFVTDELYTAIKGKGAFMNGERIQVSNAELKSSCILADAYSYLNIYRFYADSGAKFYAPVGATGYFMTAVASGKTEGACYYGAKIKSHDVIPGALLITESGGNIVSFTGETFDYKCTKFVAGTANVCDVAIKHQLEISSGFVKNRAL